MTWVQLRFLSLLHLALTILSPTTQEVLSRWLQVSLMAPSLCYWWWLGLSPDANASLNQGMYCLEFIPHRSSELSPPSRPRSCRPHSLRKTFTKSSRSSGFHCGSRWVAICLVFASEILTRLEEDNRETNITSTSAVPNSQMQVSDWKATTKDRLGGASRFLQTLLKKVPDCVNTNPVKVAFSIAKAIIEIKAVGCCLCI